MLYLTHTSGDPHDAIYIYPSPTNTSHILSPKLDVFSTVSSSTASSSDSEHSETNASQKNGFKPRGKKQVSEIIWIWKCQNGDDVFRYVKIDPSGIVLVPGWCLAGTGIEEAYQTFCDKTDKTASLTRPKRRMQWKQEAVSSCYSTAIVLL